MSRRFSEEQTVRFVKLYRKLEPLWNVTHPHYKKRSIRLACVEKIIEEMNLSDFSVKDVMVKIKCLRSTYSQEVNKIHKSLLENEPDHIYQPLLKWFPDMDYIMKNCGTSRIKAALSTLEYSENDLYYLKEEVVATPVEIEIFEQDEAGILENAENEEERPYRPRRLYAGRNSFRNQNQNFSLPPQRFSEEQTVHFVKLYKEFEPLWNVSHPDYKNKNVRIACLEKIIDGMNLSNFGPRDAMIKIKNLRSTYSQELAKIQKSLSEDEPDNFYQPILKWFPDMDYVMSKCGNSKAKSLVNLDYPNFYLREEVVETPTDFQLSQQQDQLKVTGGASGKESDTVNPPEITASSNVKERKPYRQNRRRILPKNHTKNNSINDQYQNFTVNKISEAVRELISLTRTLRTQALQNEKVEDECDIVGRHVALQLRELPPAVRLSAQLEIQKVLCNCRLNILETNHTTSCSNT